MQSPLLADHARLAHDLLTHLRDVKPAIFACYPLPYLQWLARDTLALAAPFKLDDVYALRTFFRSRFEIAPGFYKEPAIAAVLQDAGLPPMERWKRLTQPEFAAGWLSAQRYDGPAEWRSRYWGIAS